LQKEKLGGLITKQNRKYITKEVGKLLSDIWRIKELEQQEFGSHHPITRKLGSMRMLRGCFRRCLMPGIDRIRRFKMLGPI
jgi:hypothetical protein